VKVVPQALDTLPPPAVEWRRESDNERKQRMERSGVLSPPAAPLPGNEPAAMGAPSTSSWAPQQLLSQAKTQKESSKKSYTYWWGVDLARWNVIKAARDTETLTDGSFGLSFEMTHPNWRILDAQFGFGPKAVFYHGGQYAKLSNSPFQGFGYAKFSSSELGLFASLTDRADETQSDWRGFWSSSFFYLPVRWISAEASSKASMIPRSDTYSRTSLSLPGLGVQMSIGFDWNALAKIEAFAAVQGAWPLQLRSRAGLQMSMALTSPDLFLAGP
jgi:hypothetical protein